MLLLLIILLHIVFFIPRNTAQNLDLIFAFLAFFVHLIISWKIISLTNKSIRANETLVIIGYILNFIKIILLLLLVAGGFYFYTGTNQYMNISNARGAWYYLFFLCFLVFFIVVLLNFISYFGIAKENEKKLKVIIDSIGLSKD